MLRLLVCSATVAVFATAAAAQTIVINPNKSHVLPSSAAEQVRISLGINMFVPTASSDSAQALKAQENGRKLIYQAAGQECELLLSTIASNCTLESVNINVQHVAGNPNFGQRSEGYNINGNISYRIFTKEPRAETPPKTTP